MHSIHWNDQSDVPLCFFPPGCWMNIVSHNAPCFPRLCPLAMWAAAGLAGRCGAGTCLWADLGELQMKTIHVKRCWIEAKVNHCICMHVRKEEVCLSVCVSVCVCMCVCAFACARLSVSVCLCVCVSPHPGPPRWCCGCTGCCWCWPRTPWGAWGQTGKYLQEGRYRRGGRSCRLSAAPSHHTSSPWTDGQGHWQFLVSLYVIDYSIWLIMVIIVVYLHSIIF